MCVNKSQFLKEEAMTSLLGLHRTKAFFLKQSKEGTLKYNRWPYMCYSEYTDLKTYFGNKLR
jgi:hypothetical protein